MQQNVHIVSQFSRTEMCNRLSQKREEIVFVRDDYKNALDYCNYSRLCCFISKFTELSPDIIIFGIKSPLFTSQRSIE